MKKITGILSFILLSGLGMAQSNELPERKAFELGIAVDDSSFYSADIGASAYVLPDRTIQLYPGEEIFVEVELSGKEIKSMKTVRENKHPEKTMVISFTQIAEGRIHKGMMLEIHNPFKKELNYKARMLLMQHNKWVSTGVIPVRAKLSSFETWPDLIVSLALGSWEFK